MPMLPLKLALLPSVAASSRASETYMNCTTSTGEATRARSAPMTMTALSSLYSMMRRRMLTPLLASLLRAPAVTKVTRECRAMEGRGDGACVAVGRVLEALRDGRCALLQQLHVVVVVE